MIFEPVDKYHQKSACGYIISAQRIINKWVYAAWQPHSNVTTPTLGVGTKQQAIDFCLRHKMRSNKYET